MPSQTVSVEHISTFLMTRYVRLNQLISYAFTDSQDTKINLFIDLYSIYKTILSRSFRTDTKDYMATVPAIINICAHYRQYFRNIGVESKIFLISSYNCPEVNRKLVAGYNRTMMDKLQNPAMVDMLEYNISLLEILCPYLPDIHFVKTEFESFVLIDRLIYKEYQENEKIVPSLIITSDILPAQLCAKYGSVGLLKVKKYNGEDLSMIIPPQKYGFEKFISSFNEVVYGDVRLSVPETTKERVSPSNFTLLLALNGFRQRGIKVLINSAVATRLINKYGKDMHINVGTLYALERVEENPKSILSRYPEVLIEARYNALDVDYMSQIFESSIEAVNLHYDNMIDPGAVQMINSKYFANNPIDVFRL